FFFQAEDGIRDFHVTGVQTCALPIFSGLDGRKVGCQVRDVRPALLMILSPEEAVPRWTERDIVATLPVAEVMTALPPRTRIIARSEERRVGKECRSRGRRDE